MATYEEDFVFHRTQKEDDDMQKELKFWRTFYKHTRLVAQAEELSKAVASLITQAQAIQKEVNDGMKIYCEEE
jgi:hypothetical protein